jgi:hypothetical protein
MITGWTPLIVFAVAFGNAWVALIGVRFRVREGMRLWANDAGYFLPVHFRFAGFYRGLLINLNFAGASFALADVCLPGESTFRGREAIFGAALLNFLSSIVVACLVPSDFETVLVLGRGLFWRVVGVGLAVLAIYIVSGALIGSFASSLVAPAK